MKGPGIRIETAGRVARLVISNLDKRNAMTFGMWRDLRQAVVQLEQDARFSVLVIAGDGDQAFVSGADISEFQEQRSAGNRADEYGRAVLQAQRALAECSKPTVASIEGACFGGGLGLALACDLRYASSTARFRMPAARLGLGYDFDAMQQLVQVLGARTALDLFLTARTFDAAEARRLGVVHDVFASGVYAHDVGSLVDLVASNAPLTMKAAKVAIRGAVSPQPDAVRARVETLVRDCFASRDYQEGQNAFRERRPAEFVGA